MEKDTYEILLNEEHDQVLICKKLTFQEITDILKDVMTINYPSNLTITVTVKDCQNWDDFGQYMTSVKNLLRKTVIDWRGISSVQEADKDDLPFTFEELEDLIDGLDMKALAEFFTIVINVILKNVQL